MNTQLQFTSFTISGDQTAKFLQSQITTEISTITNTNQITAICNLKGKVLFGFWLSKITDNEYQVIISNDCVDGLLAHIKKYGAFSRLTLSEQQEVCAVITDNTATLSTQSDDSSAVSTKWLQKSIEQGQPLITLENSEQLQPQELRLHQMGGVHYDKGCYMGQEPVARLWFKSAPKAWLHRIFTLNEEDLIGENVSRNIKIVNYVAVENGYEALVVARPKDLDNDTYTVLSLPEHLSQDVAREKIV